VRISAGLLIGVGLLARAVGAAAAEPHAPTTVLVFVDFSGSVQGPERAAYRRDIETLIVPFLGPGDRILIAAIHDKTLTAFRPLAEATLTVIPEFNGFVDNRIRYNRKVAELERQTTETRERLKVDIARTFTSNYASRYTDIFSSMQMAQKIFESDPRRRVLVLMSDMIEDYPPYKFDAMPWRPGDGDRLLTAVTAKGLIADLDHVCIYVSGASAESAARAAQIGRFWEGYFARARADFDGSRYAHVLLHWPPPRSCRWQ
jgi:hypothetical protein